MYHLPRLDVEGTECMKDETLKELQALCNVNYCMDLVACIKQRIDKAESELARVRGLLQRILRCAECDGDNCDTHYAELKKAAFIA